MIVWALLGAVTFVSVVNLALMSVNAEAEAAAKAVFRRQGLGGVPLGCLSPLLSIVIGGLWTWYAVDVGDWRFAALFWVPFAINWVGKIARRSPKRVTR